MSSDDTERCLHENTKVVVVDSSLDPSLREKRCSDCGELLKPMPDGGTESGDTERNEPFWQIKPHRSVVQDIDQMRDNLDELESIVREAEWVELGGRGHADVERAERLCEAVEGSMPFILDSIQELVECNDCDVDAEME